MSAWDVDELLRLYAPDVRFLLLTGTLVEPGPRGRARVFRGGSGALGCAGA